MKDSLHNSFLRALEESYAAYNTPGGAQSSRKLTPIHSWFASRIAASLGGEFDVYALGMGGEKTVAGKYHPKRVDIAAVHNSKTVSVLSLKIIMSNYKQNSINYFEGLLGETANIRRTVFCYSNSGQCVRQKSVGDFCSYDTTERNKR